MSNWGFALGKTGEVRRDVNPDACRLHELWHDWMLVYGWVPFDEFRRVPLSLFIPVNRLVREALTKQEKYRLTVMQGLGYKGNKIL